MASGKSARRFRLRRSLASIHRERRDTGAARRRQPARDRGPRPTSELNVGSSIELSSRGSANGARTARKKRGFVETAPKP